MRSLVVLSVVFAVAVDAGTLKVGQGTLLKRSIGHATFVEPFVEQTVYSAPATVFASPAAVSHQSRVDVRTSPAVVATAPAVVAAKTVVEPVVAVPSYVPTATVYAGGSAVSHQSRVDVKTSPAVVTEQVIAPAYVAASPAVVATAPAVVAAKTVVEPVVAVPSYFPTATVYAGGSAVSHQSRVDVKTSPAVVTEQVVAPAYVAASPIVQAAPAYIEAGPVVEARGSVYVAPAATYYTNAAATSHQSRVDVKTSPALVAENVVYAPSVYATTW